MNDNLKNLSSTDMLGIIYNYGFNIPLKELPNYEILEINDKYGECSIRNKITGEIIKSSMSSPLLKISGDGIKSVMISREIDGVIHQTWYDVEKFNRTYLTNPHGNPILTRAFTDVDTKYGTFTFHIEKSDYPEKFGPNYFLALYHGKADEIMQSNDFDFKPTSILQTVYYPKADFHMWEAGYANFYDKLNKRFIYGKSSPFVPDSLKKMEGSIYSFKNGHISGAFIDDGSLSQEEYKPYVDPNILVRESINPFSKVNKSEPTSKALFYTFYSDALSIIKNWTSILVNYQVMVDTVGDHRFEWKNVFNYRIPYTDKNGPITYNELMDVVTSLEYRPEKNEFIESVINEINLYSYIKEQLATKDTSHPLNITNPFFVPIDDFDYYLTLLRNSDISKLVEEIIEEYANAFNMTPKEIIGNALDDFDLRRYKEHTRVVKELKRKGC